MLMNISNETIQLIEHIIVSLSIIYFVNLIRRYGFLQLIFGAVHQHVPGAQNVIHGQIEKEVDAAMDNMFPKASANVPDFPNLPKNGIDEEKVLRMMQDVKTTDLKPEEGRAWAYVYDRDEAHTSFVTRAHDLFIHTNGLNASAFPSLRKFETEIVEMTKNMLNGPKEGVGNVTSGGTESLLLAVKTYRDRARHLYPYIQQPEMIMPLTGHAALEKASHYFDVKIRYIPIGDENNFRPTVDDYRKLITKNTILLVGSAPQYPHGLVDPIEDLSDLALEKNLPLHVDACIGGFVLPFAAKLGYNIPKFDFRLPGVTSISADVHKYGFAAKGASVLVYRNAELRKHQFFVYPGWPGGLIASPTMAGTRPGGPIAAAWASLVKMGENGFQESVETIMETSIYLQKEINQIDHIQVIGEPEGSLFSFRSTNPKLNIFSLADALEEEGWKIERQQLPDCLHLTVMPQHAPVRSKFIQDIKEKIDVVLEHPERYQSGSAAMYGTVAKIPSNTMLDDMLATFMDKVYRFDPPKQ